MNFIRNEKERKGKNKRIRKLNQNSSNMLISTNSCLIGNKKKKNN